MEKLEPERILTIEQMREEEIRSLISVYRKRMIETEKEMQGAIKGAFNSRKWLELDDQRNILAMQISDLYGQLTHLEDQEEQKQIETLREVIQTVDDENIRAKLGKELTGLEDIAEGRKETLTEIEEAKQRAELFQTRTETWMSVFKTIVEKDTVATITGGCLLPLFSVAIITAMLFGVEVSEIVKSVMLVLVGYFFGYSANKMTTKEIS